MDQHRNSETNNTNSPQLPDLLNGTETNKDRQEIDKLNLLKGLGEFNMQQQGYNSTGNFKNSMFLQCFKICIP